MNRDVSAIEPCGLERKNMTAIQIKSGANVVIHLRRIDLEKFILPNYGLTGVMDIFEYALSPPPKTKIAQPASTNSSGIIPCRLTMK